MEFVSGDLYKRHVAVEGLTYEEGYLLPVNGNVNTFLHQSIEKLICENLHRPSINYSICNCSDVLRIQRMYRIWKNVIIAISFWCLFKMQISQSPPENHMKATTSSVLIDISGCHFIYVLVW